MANASTNQNERSVTEPWIKVEQTNQTRRDSKSSYELKSIIVENSKSADNERKNSGAKTATTADPKTTTSELTRDQTSAKEKTERSEKPVNGTMIGDDDDLDEYDPDLIITEEEKKAFEYMLSQKREEIDQREKLFEKWVDSITRRRMFALSRIRKLGIGHKDRLKFYGSVENYVREVDSSLNSKSSSASDDLSDDVYPLSNSSQEKGNELKREDTRQLDSASDKETDIDNSTSSGDINRNEKSSSKEHTNQLTPIVVPVES